MFWLIATILLFIVGGIFIIAGFASTCTYDEENRFGVAAVTIVIACLIILVHLFPTDFKANVPVTNTNSVPVKVTYLQYHPWSDDSVESSILLPNTTKLLHRVQIVSEVPVDIKLDM